MVLWASVMAIGRLFDLAVPVANVAAATFHLFLLRITFGAIAMLIGSWSGKRGLAIEITAAVAVETFLLEAFAPAVEGLG